MNRRGPLDSELPAGTCTVSEFAWEMKGLLADAYPSAAWVAGEVQRLRSAARGQLYFELIEKGRGDRIQAKLDCVLWADERAVTEAALREAGVELAEGVELRCCGRPDFWPGGGRLQFMVGEVDPLFSLGAFEKRRRATLKALEAQGLLERNGQLPLPAAPLEIGLVTSEGSAAWHDFLDTLVNSGLGFRVHFVHSAVQGTAAEEEIDRAFDRLAAFACGGRRLDAIALIRGGGSRSDLAAFDSRRVARAVARSPAPVIAGIGHQIDRSIADVVAHTSCKTPTEAAEFLVDRAEAAERGLEDARRRLLLRSADVLGSARQRVGAVAPRLALPARALVRRGAVDVARGTQRILARNPARALLRRRQSDWAALKRNLGQAAGAALLDVRRSVSEMERALSRQSVVPVVSARGRLRAVAGRLPVPSRRLVAARAEESRALADQASKAAGRLLRATAKRRSRLQAALLRDPFRPFRRARERVEAHRRLCDQVSPERVLARGFTLTRTAEGGLVTRTGDVEAGTELRTTVTDGVIDSRVHRVGAASRSADAGKRE